MWESDNHLVAWTMFMAASSTRSCDHWPLMITKVNSRFYFCVNHFSQNTSSKEKHGNRKAEHMPDLKRALEVVCCKVTDPKQHHEFSCWPVSTKLFQKWMENRHTTVFDAWVLAMFTLDKRDADCWLMERWNNAVASIHKYTQEKIIEINTYLRKRSWNKWASLIGMKGTRNTHSAIWSLDSR